MRQKKNQHTSENNAASVANLFNDVFGLKAWAEQKELKRSHKAVPWQWVLWGGLLFFVLGFTTQTQSVWILLVAVAAAVILFLARNTETVEPQVFLLTDETEEGKKRAATKSAERSSKPRRTSRKPANKKAAQSEKAQEVLAETTATPAKATQKRRPAKETSAKSALTTKNELATPATAASSTENKPAKPRKNSAPKTAAKSPVKRPRRPRAASGKTVSNKLDATPQTNDALPEAK